MGGHKLGEFSPTRQFHGHTPADKKAAQVAAETLTTPKTAKTVTPTKSKETSTNAKK